MADTTYRADFLVRALMPVDEDSAAQNVEVTYEG